MSLLLLTYGYVIGRLTHGSIYIFSNRMQRTLNVLFVESCASNTSSSSVTSEVDSSNANVEGPIATSSGTTTVEFGYNGFGYNVNSPITLHFS